MTVREYIEDKIEVREIIDNGKRAKIVVFPEKKVLVKLSFDSDETEIENAREKIITSLEEIFEVIEENGEVKLELKGG